MLVLLSPAKTFNTKDKVPFEFAVRQPMFVEQANTLASQLAKLTQTQVSDLLNISDKLASLNVERYKGWEKQSTLQNSKPACFAFWGDVNKNLNAFTLTQKELEKADQHLVYLSGMYGALKPLDFIQEYRLEMGTDFATAKDCKNLYQLWKQTVTQYLNQRITDENVKFVINLASKEYYEVVDFTQLTVPVVEIVFKEQAKDGKYKVISLIAKRSRGLMARWLIQNNIKTLAQVKQFNQDGYYFVEDESIDKQFVFKRDKE